MYEIVMPDCNWCLLPCEVPENTIQEDSAEGEELHFCSRSCQVAYHG